MNYPWLEDYCSSKVGVEKDYKAEWDATRFMLFGKMFAMRGGDKNGKAIITLKLDPQLGYQLRRQYPDIIPGYYMNKEHWNSVYLDGVVPEEVLKKMIDDAYLSLFETLTKKQKAIITQR